MGSTNTAKRMTAAEVIDPGDLLGRIDERVLTLKDATAEMHKDVRTLNGRLDSLEKWRESINAIKYIGVFLSIIATLLVIIYYITII